jgi:hypothetical protein
VRRLTRDANRRRGLPDPAREERALRSRIRPGIAV